jgi:Domain of unknown function (DUF4926)
MQLPNRALASIEQEKLTEYLLNTRHKRGGTKARLLAQFGYTVWNWKRLEADIRSGLGTEVDLVRSTEYGTRYEIRMTLQTPLGVSLTVRTIWQIDDGREVPRLITLYPDWASEVRMANFTPYQDVVLLHDIPEEGVCAGDVGTVVDRHDVPGREPGYSVEFFDMLGNTVAVVTLPATALRAPSSADRPAVRPQRVPMNMQ